MVNFSCLLTFSLMTPAESGLEMAKLTRPDTDTSLLNTNMSAASWQNIKRQERESFLVWFKRETERVCLLFLLVFSASLISNIGLARHLQNCLMFKFWDEAGSSLWHHDSWAPIWLLQENIQIIGHWAFSSSLEPAVASFSDPDQMVKNKAHTRELARNPKLITSGLLQDPPVWLDGWVWSWCQLIWEVADPSFLPTPPVLGGGPSVGHIWYTTPRVSQGWNCLILRVGLEKKPLTPTSSKPGSRLWC